MGGPQGYYSRTPNLGAIGASDTPRSEGAMSAYQLTFAVITSSHPCGNDTQGSQYRSAILIHVAAQTRSLGSAPTSHHPGWNGEKPNLHLLPKLS